MHVRPFDYQSPNQPPVATHRINPIRHALRLSAKQQMAAAQPPTQAADREEQQHDRALQLTLDLVHVFERQLLLLPLACAFQAWHTAAAAAREAERAADEAAAGAALARCWRQWRGLVMLKRRVERSRCDASSGHRI